MAHSLRVPLNGRTRGIPGLVYHTIRGTTRLVGVSHDALLVQLDAVLDSVRLRPSAEALQAAANGVLGDHREASANPLAFRCGCGVTASRST